MEDIELDVMTDEELSQMIHEIDPDWEYEKYRDDWGDRLHEALKEVYDEFVEPKKHGYYQGSPEKFLEHTIAILEGITKCNVNVFQHSITAVKREPPKIEFVEQEVTEDELHNRV